MQLCFGGGSQYIDASSTSTEDREFENHGTGRTASLLNAPWNGLVFRPAP